MAGVRVKRKKQRAKNFCEGELNILFEGVALKKDLLFSKLNTAVVSKNKAKAWNNIADKINSQFHGTRTGKQVKKKWQDVKQECLRIRALQKCPPTGGDPPPEDPWYADAVLNVLGEKTNLLDGIPGETEMVGFPHSVD
ncbi:hypothetical protein BaRGS_00023339 [Batillaria attramentaria]|uniref:Myb/SANT-like DNA-binding domain-containing protein n=1 Tax=Batillaria attramentaria TaxID=370345 RepID=A0ABD0KEE7_9CAEN